MEENASTQRKEILSAEEEDGGNSVITVESLCISCNENGITKLLLTKIPLFKDIIIASFECPHCGYSNNEVQQSDGREDFGVKITLDVKCTEDLNRQLIKSEFASIRLEELDFEIPAETQKGTCNTVEGILKKAADELEVLQNERRQHNEDIATQIQNFIKKLIEYSSGSIFPFKITLDDPSGKSHIQSLDVLTLDGNLKVEKYTATKEQLQEMGYYGVEAAVESNTVETKELPDDVKMRNWDLNVSMEENVDNQDDGEAITFMVMCPRCGRSGENNICKVDIPGFRKCVLMAFLCEYCGAKENELKSTEEFGEKGRRWVLTVKDEKDLNRDILLSGFSAISIPHLQFEMERGTQDSTYTTIEGLIQKIVTHLETFHEFTIGDSAVEGDKQKHLEAIDKIRKLTTDSSVFPFQLVLDDLVDHSFIGCTEKTVLSALPDDNLLCEFYDRTKQQNEELGIAEDCTANDDS